MEAKLRKLCQKAVKAEGLNAFSKRAGIPAAVVSKWLNKLSYDSGSVKTIKLTTAIRIAEALGKRLTVSERTPATK